MTENTQRDNVNEAIARFVRTGWSKDLAAQIENVFGAECAQQARAVYDAAMNAPVDWETSDMNSALAVLADFMTVEFPWLSAPARTWLNYCYILVWK